MFQFRRFPTYAYFIQRRLTQYCCAGFPHSEISGSKPICGSPKLIAACHVLHRLLMPRHSPCALISLTSHSALAECMIRTKDIFGSLKRIMQASEFRSVLPLSQLYCCVLPLIKVPHLKTKNSTLLLAPSSGIIIILFSFQGAALTFKVRFQSSIA